MVSWGIPIALIFGALLAATNHQALDELVRATVTLYLLIAGFAMLLLQRRAWEFLRPLLLMGVALLVLPPLFYDLAQNLQRAFRYTVSPHISIGREWLWAVLAAVIVFILVRLLIWYRSRPRRTRQQVLRERERVLPHVDVEEEEGE